MGDPVRYMEETPFAVPLLISFLYKRAEIPMNELFERLCLIIQPLLKDENLQRQFDLALNVKSSEIGHIISGFIRLKMEQKFQINMPMDLKILIMDYIKFEIEEELPFELRMDWGFNSKISIKNDPNTIVSFDKTNVQFAVIWDDVSKTNAEYCKRENRLPVDID